MRLQNPPSIASVEPPSWWRETRLSHLRQSSRALRRGKMLLLQARGHHLVYARQERGQTFLIAFNNDAKPAALARPGRADAGLRTGSSGAEERAGF